MSYDCSSIAALITPEVQLEYASKMLYECSQNVCGMAAEYGSSVQEFKPNAARIPRMYFECTSNVTRMSQCIKNMAGILLDRVSNAAESSTFISLNTTAIEY